MPLSREEIGNIGKEAADKTMSELDQIWKIKTELENLGKKLTCSCDWVNEPYDVYKFGFKCAKSGEKISAGIEIKPEITEPGRCNAYILSIDGATLEKLRQKDAWRVAPYDKTRQAEGKPFDAQLYLTCRQEEFERVFDYIKDFI